MQLTNDQHEQKQQIVNKSASKKKKRHLGGLKVEHLKPNADMEKFCLMYIFTDISSTL